MPAVFLVAMRIVRVLLSCLLLFFSSFVIAMEGGISSGTADCVATAGDAAAIDSMDDVPGEVDEFVRIAPPIPPTSHPRGSTRHLGADSGLAEVFLPAPPEPPTPA